VSIFLESLQHQFIRDALLTGVLIACLNGLLSFFVVQNNLAFAGTGIAHATFGGLAMGVFLGQDPFLMGALFATIMAFGVAVTSSGGDIQPDVGIGVAFSASMALGVILISTARGRYFGELFSYLFGNILAVNSSDIWLILATALLSSVIILVFFRQLLLVSLQQEIARAQGVWVGLIKYGLMLLLAVSVVVSVKLVGVVMASALLVIPGAVGHVAFDNYRSIIICSFVSGIASVVLGIEFAYRFDFPAGASVVMFLTAAFIISLIISHIKVRKF